MRKIKKVALALILPLVTIEVGLRLAGLGSPVLILPDKGHAEGGYGYIPAPDQDVFRFFARNKINHFSMRSEDFDAAKAPDHLRVLFIGDSVTYGTTSIGQARIFTSLIAQELPKLAGRPVDVLNASAGGWAPGNEVGFLKSKGAFGSDLVLIVLNTADLNQPFVDFEPAPNNPTVRPMTAMGEAWSRYLAPRLFSAKSLADPGSLPSPPKSDSMSQEVEAILATLEDGRTYSLSHNAAFGVVCIPAHSASWDGADYQMGKRMLEKWAEQKRVPLIDLTEDFAGRSLDELYLERGDSFIHLAPLGHRIVASRLMRDLPSILGIQKQLR